MGIDNLEKILLSVANCDSAMAALPDSVRVDVLSVKGEVDRRVKEREEAERKRESERREAEEKADKARRAKAAKILCKATWAERVPLNRRFALCESIGKAFVGFDGQERDQTKWVDRVEVCPIDLVRGFMGPYWGYYVDRIDAAFKERITPILEACCDAARVREIGIGFEFFHITKHGNRPFRILTYDVDNDGHVQITGRSEPKTWEQHRADLKAEFAQEGDADSE